MKEEDLRRFIEILMKIKGRKSAVYFPPGKEQPKVIYDQSKNISA